MVQGECGRSSYLVSDQGESLSRNRIEICGVSGGLAELRRVGEFFIRRQSCYDPIIVCSFGSERLMANMWMIDRSRFNLSLPTLLEVADRASPEALLDRNVLRMSSVGAQLEVGSSGWKIQLHRRESRVLHERTSEPKGACGRLSCCKTPCKWQLQCQLCTWRNRV